MNKKLQSAKKAGPDTGSQSYKDLRERASPNNTATDKRVAKLGKGGK